jgi:hypothetical protein
VDVVGMRMREKHAVDCAEAGVDRLLAQIRAGIHEHAGRGAGHGNALRE